MGINEGTLGNWCAREQRRDGGDPTLSESERAELERLRRENVELRMQRDDAPMFRQALIVPVVVVAR